MSRILPKEITIGSTVWTVKYKQNFEDLGECDYESSTITIKSSLGRQAKTRVFIHECIHAALYNAGQDEHDEQVVDAIANALPQIFNQMKEYM